MATIVYIDGFNFYKGALEGTPYKWLDLARFADLLLPNDQIVAVRYFTARMRGGSGTRQDVYWRALRATSRVSIHEGKFRLRTKRGRLVPGGQMAQIEAPEEKGSDVNLACWMLLDAAQGLNDSAVVVSNDSDLRTPVQMVKDHFGISVGVVNPRHPNSPDQLPASFHLRLTQQLLVDAQLPSSIVLPSGRTVTKPATW